MREFAFPQTQEEKDGLERIRQLISKEDTSFMTKAMAHAAPEEDETELLLRFLRARKNIPEKSLKMMQEDIAWRESYFNMGIERMRNSDPSDILGCDTDKLEQHFPHGFLGYDIRERPIIYKMYGSFLVNNLTKHTSIEALVAYDVWLTEKSIQKLNSAAQSFVIIIDLNGMGWKHMAPVQLKYCRGLADAGSPHYPERLGSMYIINSPKIFVWAFTTINSWLDKRTQEKIFLLGGKDIYMPELKKIMNLDLLPRTLGGKGALTGPESVHGGHVFDSMKT